MRFSIITPSFRSSSWLKLCIASVADQGVDLEHIVQDAGSDDGTLDWLLTDRRVKAFVEKDKGMYDAVNRGLRKSNGDILSYLNCDEQYLPGALAAVGQFFDQHPEADVVFTDTVIVDPDGRYLCSRRTVLPTRYHSMVSLNLAIMTCATFFRRRLIEEKNGFFDDRLRDLGDAHWVLNLLDKQIPMAVLPHFTTAFTDTGENMNLKPNAQREKAELYAAAPAWARALRQWFILHFRVRKFLAGAYALKPFEYSLYTQALPERRTPFQVSKPTGRWTRFVPPQSKP